MSERPKSMDEFAVGMREAAAHGDYATSIRSASRACTASCAVERALAYVRKHFKFVTMDQSCGGKTTHIRAMLPRPAPEPKPPDAVREAAERLNAALDRYALAIDADLVWNKEVVAAREALGAALNAE